MNDKLHLDRKNRPTILIAEDDIIYQKLYRTKLNNAGFDVDIADNGLEATIKYKSNPTKYCIILMDLSMPIMDGYEAVTNIREQGNDILPIIAVTSNVDKATRTKCVRAGFNGFIPKPVKLLDLLAQINQWLDNASCEDDQAEYLEYANTILHK